MNKHGAFSYKTSTHILKQRKFIYLKNRSTSYRKRPHACARLIGRLLASYARLIGNKWRPNDKFLCLFIVGVVFSPSLTLPLFSRYLFMLSLPSSLCCPRSCSSSLPSHTVSLPLTSAQLPLVVVGRQTDGRADEQRHRHSARVR